MTLKIAQKQSIPGCTIVTRVENNQREKVLYKIFLPRISNHPGKYGYPGMAFKSDQNQSFFRTQVWFDPGTTRVAVSGLLQTDNENKYKVW